LLERRSCRRYYERRKMARVKNIVRMEDLVREDELQKSPSQ
jgi:hypothetical protein